MTTNEGYIISIKIEDEETDFDPNNFSLSLHDSIYSIYNDAEIIFDDITGFFRETLLSSEGVKYNILLSNKIHDNILPSCDYIVESDECLENLQFGVLSNKIKIRFINNYYSKQNIENKAYKGSISSVINNVLQNDFEKKDVQNCDCNTIWYRIASDQKTFLEKILLKNAYSKSIGDFPFFMFTTFDGKFNFKNIKTLLDKKPIASLEYNPQNRNTFNENSILDCKPFKTGSLNLKKYYLRKNVIRNYETGKFTEENVAIKDNQTNGLKIPILGTNNKITKYDYYNLSQKINGEKEALKGRIVQNNRMEFFVDRLIITVPFNPMLKSGEMVDLNLSIISSKNTSEPSLYQSGKYLIEDCVHTWSNASKNATTRLVVGRKSCIIPNFKLSQRLI